MKNQEYKYDENARAELIRQLQEENKEPMSPAEIREQMASYIASNMDGYPREKIDEYLNENYGEIPTA